ncbi:uncharacterized protein LOC131957245 [Physella acuta]|uniref:uncharacterized protein LOC131957245 n=1 Tax=Physella acuta TaxID=109671 RepID=UPI0027DBF49C|nr:uncharacterized protein LOC131957245 [Physella acuta]
MDVRDKDLCYKNNVSVVATCSVLKKEVRPSVRFAFQINSIFVTDKSREVSNESHYISQHEFLFFKGGVYAIACFARNSQFPEIFNSTAFTLEIQEPPFRPIIELNRINWLSTYSTEESTSFQLDEGMFSINCYAKGGHPAVQNVRLSCSQELISLSGGQDTYLNVSRSKNNITCTCEASHITQCYSNTTDLHIYVHYYPRIKSFLVNGKSSSAATLNKSSVLNLTCEAEGNPPPTLMLYLDQSRRVPLQQSNNATLVWEKVVGCYDTGVYFCLASRNSVEFKRSINISVLCPLKLKYPGTNASTYYGRTHEDFSIQIEFFGYPGPKQFWLIKNLTDRMETNQESDTNSSYKIEYKHEVPPYGTIVLTIFNLQKSDFTNMSVYIDNSLGVLVYSFSIIEDTEQENKGVIIIASSISAVALILATVALWIFKCPKKTKKVTSGQPVIEIKQLDVSIEEINNPYIDVIDPYEMINNDYDVIETQSQKFQIDSF